MKNLILPVFDTDPDINATMYHDKMLGELGADWVMFLQSFLGRNDKGFKDSLSLPSFNSLWVHAFHQKVEAWKFASIMVAGILNEYKTRFNQAHPFDDMFTDILSDGKKFPPSLRYAQSTPLIEEDIPLPLGTEFFRDVYNNVLHVTPFNLKSVNKVKSFRAWYKHQYAVSPERWDFTLREQPSWITATSPAPQSPATSRRVVSEGRVSYDPE